MKPKTYFIIGVVLLFVGLCASVGILYNSWQKEKAERMRFENNFDISQKASKQWQDKYGKSVSESNALVLTIAELKEYRKADAKTIKDLKIKHLTSAASIGTTTTVPFVTIVKDSLIHDTVAACIDFKDNYAQINGCIMPNKTFVGTFSINDTIRTFGSVTYRKWLIFRCRLFGIESVKQTVLSSNPYTKIVWSEYITLKR